MEGCLFCKILKREIPATIVHEDERSLAFRDIHPVAPTHVLVIPKTHVATIDDVLPEHELDMGHLFRVAAEVARQEGLSGRGYRVVMNSGAEAGQSVFHVHLHVVGGRALGWPPFPKA
ncbi:MAG: histidine triad nucleotide-binding protein [Polyangiaceae bacterium]